MSCDDLKLKSKWRPDTNIYSFQLSLKCFVLQRIDASILNIRVIKSLHLSLPSEGYFRNSECILK
jgi:hypothetical protein